MQNIIFDYVEEKNFNENIFKSQLNAGRTEIDSSKFGRGFFPGNETLNPSKSKEEEIFKNVFKGNLEYQDGDPLYMSIYEFGKIIRVSKTFNVKFNGIEYKNLETKIFMDALVYLGATIIPPEEINWSEYPFVILFESIPDPSSLDTFSIAGFQIITPNLPENTELTIDTLVVPSEKVTVEFNMKGHGEQIPSQEINVGDCAEEPDEPVADNCEFMGWYTEPECINEFEFNTRIEENTTLYANWISLNGNYIVFSSSSNFTLNTTNYSKNWDGTLYYSTNGFDWNIWDGTTTIGNSKLLYLRGTENTKISVNNAELETYNPWVLSGTAGINCNGNIENLLNYTTVIDGYHPQMADGCYEGMFYNCTSLISAPELPATTLTTKCYVDMFKGCTSLTIAPELPATILTRGCYLNMFSSCTALTVAPELPATTLASNCYDYMFSGCTSLTTSPELPATILANKCYRSMFYNCILIKLSTTQTGNYTIPYRIPTIGIGTDATNALKDMFSNTGGTFTGTPSINTTYYLYDYSNDNTGTGR